MRTAVAIDAGGTSTRALVDESGVLSSAAGAGNLTSSGRSTVAACWAATMGFAVARRSRPGMVLLSAAD
jgi:N-acetylglucosamine kinase-like BadF-type ATPase